RRDEFYKELPFYAVKPLYTFTAFSFYKLGVPLIQCTVLPSTICFLFIGVFLLLWTKRYMSLPAACALCFLIMSTSIMLAIAKNSTPDCISALFIFGSVYFLVERKNIIWSTVFILLSTFARIDNVIFACLLLGLIAITANKSNQTRLRTGLLFIFLLAISFFSTTLTVLPFHWSPLFYPNFAQSMNTSYSVHHSFTLHDYIEVAKSHFMTGLFFSNTALFIVLGYLALDKSPPGDDRHDLQNKILFLFLLAIMIRFVFQPIIDDRFYIGYYLCILCFLIKNQFSSRKVVRS
ncbi:MAG TPA: hypothetical protein VFV08_06955, partial [Puia sp.]|nr:hypothetical protein [Puia sp.]